jgi:hypothetical protein
MTDDLKRAHEEQLMAAFAVVLTHPAGFGIELFADLWIKHLEDGRFRVSSSRGVSEEIFDEVRDAIGYYLDLRDNLKLGLDYEREPQT